MTGREIKAEGKRLFDAYRKAPGKPTQDAVDAASLEVQADVLRRVIKRHGWAINKVITSTNNSRRSIGVIAFGDAWPYSLASRLLGRRLPLTDADLTAFVEPLTRSKLIDPGFDAVWFSTFLRYLQKRHAAGRELPPGLIDPLKTVRGFVRTAGWQAKDGRKLKASINETIKLIQHPPAAGRTGRKKAGKGRRSGPKT